MPLGRNEDLLQFDKTFCKLGQQCPSFARFTDNRDTNDDDAMHCSTEVYAGRRGGMSIEDDVNSKKFLSAYQHCTKIRAHQGEQNFWGGIVREGDLTEEVTRNGYGYVLTPARDK